MTATVVLAAWALAFAAVRVAWTTSERRASIRVWCPRCQRTVHQDLTEHLMAAHGDEDGWCGSCQRTVPLSDLRAHRALSHTPRVTGPEDRIDRKDPK